MALGQPRHQAPKMTKKHNANAAFMAVTTGVLDKLDAGLISRSTGVPLAEIEQMIAARREREQ
jgi:hypothetical protein